MNEEEREADTSAEFSICPYAYGSGEHFAWELRRRFDALIAEYVLRWIDTDTSEGNVAVFLNSVLQRYGLEEAQFCAQYLSNFDVMPPLSDWTREQLALIRFEQDYEDDA